MTREIRWRLHLRASPAVVYGFLASDAGRARWWVVRSEERDGLLELAFADGETLIVPVLERQPPARFALRWLGGSELRFALRPDGAGGTDLDLLACDVPDAAYREQHAGWVAALLALKAAVDHGVDLRSHDPARGWAAGFVDG